MKKIIASTSQNSAKRLKLKTPLDLIADLAEKERIRSAANALLTTFNAYSKKKIDTLVPPKKKSPDIKTETDKIVPLKKKSRKRKKKTQKEIKKQEAIEINNQKEIDKQTAIKTICKTLKSDQLTCKINSLTTEKDLKDAIKSLDSWQPLYDETLQFEKDNYKNLDHYIKHLKSFLFYKLSKLYKTTFHNFMSRKEEGKDITSLCENLIKNYKLTPSTKSVSEKEKFENLMEQLLLKSNNQSIKGCSISIEQATSETFPIKILGDVYALPVTLTLEHMFNSLICLDELANLKETVSTKEASTLSQKYIDSFNQNKITLKHFYSNIRTELKSPPDTASDTIKINAAVIESINSKFYKEFEAKTAKPPGYIRKTLINMLRLIEPALTSKPKQIVAPHFLRLKQKEDYKKIIESIFDNQERILVTKPTGTGKTAIMAAVANFLFLHEIPLIIIVPGNTLITQTKNAFLKYINTENSGLALKPDNIGQVNRAKNIYELKREIIIINDRQVSQCLKELQKENKEKYTAKEYLIQTIIDKGVVICDEAHHLNGRLLKEYLLNRSKAPIIGFSASTEKGQYKDLDELFTARPVTQTLLEAIQSEECSPLHCMTVDFTWHSSTRGLRKKLNKIEHQIKNADGDGDEKMQLRKQIRELLDEFMNSQYGFTYTLASIFMQALKFSSEHAKGMFFCSTIKHAKRTKKILSTIFLNDTVHIVHSQLNSVVNEERKKEFQDPNSNCKVIISVGTLDEGFDCPNAKVICDMRFYRTIIRRMVQTAGRGLRPMPNGEGCIYISAKVLNNKDQLLPYKDILDKNQNGTLGEEKYRNKDFLNPENYHIPEDYIEITDPDTGDLKKIVPFSAKLRLPNSKKAKDLGKPPKSDEEKSEVTITDTTGSSTTLNKALKEKTLAFDKHNKATINSLSPVPSPTFTPRLPSPNIKKQEFLVREISC